jgi:hypothetical protein
MRPPRFWDKSCRANRAQGRVDTAKILCFFSAKTMKGCWIYTTYHVRIIFFPFPFAVSNKQARGKMSCEKSPVQIVGLNSAVPVPLSRLTSLSPNQILTFASLSIFPILKISYSSSFPKWKKNS